MGKGFNPTDPKECHDGVSLAVIQSLCNSSSNQLTLTLKNNGRFNIAGYYIGASTNESSGIGGVDLTKYWVKEQSSEGITTTKGAIIFVPERFENRENPLGISDNRIDVFDLSNVDTIHFIRILPLRREKINGRDEVVVCGRGIEKHDVSC